jgi:hypothetical protein
MWAGISAIKRKRHVSLPAEIRYELIYAFLHKLLLFLSFLIFLFSLNICTLWYEISRDDVCNAWSFTSPSVYSFRFSVVVSQCKEIRLEVRRLETHLNKNYL